MIATIGPTDEQLTREFKELLPELSGRLRYRFFENGLDVMEEFTAEGIALAWQMFLSARRKGKEVAITTLTWYAIRQVLSGRRLGGFTSNDAMSATKLSRQRIGAHVSINGLGENPSSFYQIFGDRRARWNSLDLVQPKVDWAEFIAGCDQRDQRIAEMKVEGYPQTQIAAELHISTPAICQRLQALRRRWDAAQAVA